MGLMLLGLSKVYLYTRLETTNQNLFISFKLADRYPHPQLVIVCHGII